MAKGAPEARRPPRTPVVAPTLLGAPGLFSPAEPVRSLRDRLPFGVLLVLLLGLAVVFRLRAEHPLGVRTDSWTEANIFVSARNVAVNGWKKYHGAAQHQVDRPPFREDPFFRYAQYPLGTYYLNWLLFDLGAQTLPAWRWPPMLLSLLSLALWYVLLCRFVGRWVALLSTVFLGTSYGFLDFADNVHHGYSNVLVVGMALSFVAGVGSVGRRRLILLATSWVLLFITGFVSWEWYLWSQAFYWGYALLIGVPFKKRWLLAFAAALLLAFAIQSHQRNVALGPQPGAGFAADFLRRTIRLDAAPDTPEGVTLKNYPLYVMSGFRAYYGMGIATLALLAFGWGLFFGDARRSIRTAHPAFRLVLILFFCSISWWCVMLQHTSVHPHVMRHAQLLYALVLGLAVAAGGSCAVGRDRPFWARAVGVGVVVFVLWAHCTRSYENFRLHADPRARNPWDGGWSESTQLSDLARRLPDDAIVLTNKSRVPLMRFWTNQPVYLASSIAYPYSRRGRVPGSRTLFELTISHLKDLYGDRLPRVLYVYYFHRDPREAYWHDGILRQLIDGTWGERPTAEGVDNFERVIGDGSGQTAHPIVARGSNWIAFDVRAIFDNLPAAWQSLPPPTRAQFGPPR